RTVSRYYVPFRARDFVVLMPDPSAAAAVFPYTTLFRSIGSGAKLTDMATLSGGYSETGTITFKLLAPDGVTVVDTETVTVSGNGDRKSTRLNSSHGSISYAVFCLKKTEDAADRPVDIDD